MRPHDSPRHSPFDAPNHSPTTPRSPALPRRRRVAYSDRFIPNRTGVDLQAAFLLADRETTPVMLAETELETRQQHQADRTFSQVLRNELFGDQVPQSVLARPPRDRLPERLPRRTPVLPRRTPVFTYRTPMALPLPFVSLLPIRPALQQLLLSPQRRPRQVLRVPVCCLDAPDLADDFYLNLVDWSSQDVLGVGLKLSVYLWNAANGSVTTLCDLAADTVTSLAWVGAGTHLAVGTQLGLVEIWDATKQRCTRTMTGHSARTAALAWNEHVLTLGLRDRLILHRDVRDPAHYMTRLRAHTQEVCGLRWNVDENRLASGSNDNRVCVWEGTGSTPVWQIEEHVAAVKALAWLPHARGTLATGGGTQDRRIKIWNVGSEERIADIDTGLQVCNMLWLRNLNELVSTHGYLRHQVAIWKAPSMEQVASLTGHSFRVLHLALSPDGSTIVTGAGDETLRFWNVFDKKVGGRGGSTLMEGFKMIR